MKIEEGRNIPLTHFPAGSYKAQKRCGLADAQRGLPEYEW